LFVSVQYTSALLVFTDTGLLYDFLFSVCIGRWICKCSKIDYILQLRGKYVTISSNSEAFDKINLTLSAIIL